MKTIALKISKLFSIRVIAIGLTFIQTIALTQVFGSEVFGLLSFALSVSAILVLLLSFGLDQLIMRELAALGLARAFQSRRLLVINKLVKILVIPVALAVSALGLSITFYSDIAINQSNIMFIIFFAIPFVLLRKYIESIAQGMKLLIGSILGSQFVYPILITFGSLCVVFFGLKANVLNIASIYFIAVLGSLITSYCAIRNKFLRYYCRAFNRKKVQSSLWFTPFTREDTDHLKSGMYLSFVSIGFVLGQHIDVLLVGIISTPEDVAIVRIASRVAEMAGLMRAIILLQYKPLLSEAYFKKDKNLLIKHSSFMTRVYSLTGIPIALMLFVFSNEVMLLFGPEFVEGALVMRIYVSGVLITLLFGPSNAILAMSENEAVASRILVNSLIIQVLLNIVLIPTFASLGCAIANLSALLYLSMHSRYIVKQNLGVETSILVFFHEKFR